MSVNKIFSNLICFSGLLVLLHAAYSANHYKTLSIVSGLGTSSYPPFDIIVECLISLTLIILGQIMPLKFEPVIMTADRASRSTEESFGRPEFITFNHRSRELKKRSENYLKSKST